MKSKQYGDRFFWKEINRLCEHDFQSYSNPSLLFFDVKPSLQPPSV